ncbi:MAG: transaldolase [Gammaproteobacteria bacterium]|nr:MAG: transaldolase [Gammaproteobacteria bacterium]
MSTSKLEQLQQFTEVVADTGDIDAIERFKPQDATTNPSLILKAVDLPAFQPLMHTAAELYRKADSRESAEAAALDFLSTAIGADISKRVPGYVSTEVDARLSFRTEATVERVKSLADAYANLGVSPDRILFKIASTWEGIRAAEQLEKEGLRCNLTLLFSFAQAVACAQAGVTLISPFVGRIYDWYCQHRGVDHIPAEEDPGVLSVRRIYHYYKSHGYATIVMGASFRNTGEIEALAGCDKLTISPALLEQLSQDTGTLERRLMPNNVQKETVLPLDEADFRWQLNEDAMATEKLAEGIRKFAADQNTLLDRIRSLASA